MTKLSALKLIPGKWNRWYLELGLSIVALVGDNMKSHPGISGKMFGAMGRNGVNVRAIAQGSSERNISAVIAAADVKKDHQRTCMKNFSKLLINS